MRSLSSGFVDAMILSPLRTDDELVEEIREAPVPVVVIGRTLADRGIDSVSTDSAGGSARRCGTCSASAAAGSRSSTGPSTRPR